MFLLSALLCWGLCTSLLADDGTCSVEEKQDDRTYIFAFIGTYPPYKYLNKNGVLAGNDVDLVRFICAIMNKKCATTLTNSFNTCWSEDRDSPGLNNRWFDVCVGGLQTAERKAALGFLAEYAREPSNYLYVKHRSDINTLDEIKNKANIGFGSGWWTGPSCLKKFFSMKLDGRTRDDYLLPEDLINGLEKNEVDAILLPANLGDGDDRLDRVSSESISCADAGYSFMMRKDEVDNMRWLETGLQKLRDNGDYHWICNLHKVNEEPDCF